MECAGGEEKLTTIPMLSNVGVVVIVWAQTHETGMVMHKTRPPSNPQCFIQSGHYSDSPARSTNSHLPDLLQVRGTDQDHACSCLNRSDSASRRAIEPCPIAHL